MAAISIAQLSHHVTVEDCYIFGSHRALLAANVHFLTVRSSEHSGYPAYEWMRITRFDGDKSTNYWGVGETNMKMGFLTHNGVGLRIENCLVYEMYDAFRPRGGDSEFTSLYRENVMMSSVDEHIEYDTFWHNPLHLRVTKNFFLDALASQALSPVMGGHLTIDHNLLYYSPEKGMETYFFKFDVPPGMRKQGFSPVHNILIAHNTFVNGRGNLIWSGQGKRWGYSKCIFENNLWFSGRRPGNWNVGMKAKPEIKSPWIPTEFNLIAGNSVNKSSLGSAKKTFRPVLKSEPIRSADPKTTGKLITDVTKEDVITIPGITYPMVDFNLLPNSDAVDSGRNETALATEHPTKGDAPDMGALELNQDWAMPMPGPRWAVGELKPWRPPLPASLSPHWLGLHEGATKPEHEAVFPLGEGHRAKPITLHFHAHELLENNQQNWKVINEAVKNDASSYLQATPVKKYNRVKSDIPSDFTVEFEIDEVQSLRIWFRVKSPGGGANSFWIKPDGLEDVSGDWVMINAVPGDWSWISWQGNGATFDAGKVTIDFLAREKGVLLADIVITNEWNGLPAGPWN